MFHTATTAFFSTVHPSPASLMVKRVFRRSLSKVLNLPKQHRVSGRRSLVRNIFTWAEARENWGDLNWYYSWSSRFPPKQRKQALLSQRKHMRYFTEVIFCLCSNLNLHDMVHAFVISSSLWRTQNRVLWLNISRINSSTWWAVCFST
jgi:hypothetical protein